MKTVYKLKMYGIASLIIALSVFPIYSCSSSSDDMTTEPDPNQTPNPTPDPPADTKVTTLISNFGANDGLSIDEEGNIYASNFGNFMGTQILKVNPETSEAQTSVGSLRAPTGNLIDGSGNTFVVHNVRRVEPNSAETLGDVLKIDADGNRTTLAELPGFPSGITMDGDGSVYISNFDFPGVHRITSEGALSIYVEDQRLEGGVGIDFDDNGNLFVGNFITGQILKINPDKSVEVLATLPTVRQNFVIGYITFLNGAIYATAAGEHRIYRISLTGETSVLAGTGAKSSIDGSLEQASFDTPNGIVGDPDKNVLYITEGENARLRQIDLN